MNFLSPALNLLVRCYSDPRANPKWILARWLEENRGGETSQVTRTFYGVLRKEIALTHIIGRFTRKKNRAIAPRCLVLLKIAIYLLVYSDSFPDHAVVDRTVALADRPFKGFLNATLRNVARQKLDLREELSRSADMTLRHSISPLLVENLGMISRDVAGDLEYLDSEPLFHLRVNPRLINFTAARQILVGEKIEFSEIPDLETFQVKRIGALICNHVKRGFFYLQNSGSQIVTAVAAAHAQQRVYDPFSAPGTKSVTLALLRPDVRLFSSDIHLGRLERMKDNIETLNLKGISPFAADALSLPVRTNSADLVLIDAPCTSSGTIRKNPDLKFRITGEMIAAKTAIQLAALKSLAAVFPRSRLLYAVCSFLHDETESLLEKLAADIPFRSIDLSPLLERYHVRFRTGRSGYYLLPSGLNNDLFYISLFQPVPGFHPQTTRFSS